MDEKFKCKVQVLVQKGAIAKTFALVLYLRVSRRGAYVYHGPLIVCIFFHGPPSCRYPCRGLGSRLIRDGDAEGNLEASSLKPRATTLPLVAVPRHRSRDTLMTIA